MGKHCNICNKKLSIRDSFVWKNEPICKSCLQKIDPSSSPEVLAHSDYNSKIFQGVLLFIIGTIFAFDRFGKLSPTSSSQQMAFFLFWSGFAIFGFFRTLKWLYKKSRSGHSGGNQED